jgi:hypothetical protein
MPSSSEYLAIPADVGTTTARVWVGSVVNVPSDPARVWLEHAPSGARWPLGQWKRWTVPDSADRFIRYQRVTLTGLQPDTTYPLTLKVDGRVQANAQVTTLPIALPPMTQSPFTVLLGSCFCRMQDESGRVGRAFVQLPGGAKPRIKFLVGDQVYLDSPWYRFVTPIGTKRLARGFLDQYTTTWGQQGDSQGFNLLLSTGANYFCADDHEFWNNGPFPSSFAVNTWTSARRDTWWTIAKQLYAAFQSEQSLTRIDIGAFSTVVLDTRVNRKADRSEFMTAADLKTLAHWVDGLQSPGMLVVGQPIFATKAGFMGRFADWNLPDFAQYAEFCGVLLASRQSILVVTGDVHYGRIARAPLPSGGEIVELISSPMALVDKAAGGSWKKAPDRFPFDPIPGVKSVPVTTTANWQLFANHFVTIDLNEFGGGLRFRVRTWETEPADGVSADALVADITLKKGV